MANYAKITKGKVEAYPYSIGQLRRDNPNTSFPKSIPDETLAEYGVFTVADQPTPSFDLATQRAEQATTPELVDGLWVIGWSVVNLTAEEIAAKVEAKGAEVRANRDRLLTSCDWTQVADAPVNKTAWAAYRQELRDIPEQVGFPGNVVWPEAPQ